MRWAGRGRGWAAGPSPGAVPVPKGEDLTKGGGAEEKCPPPTGVSAGILQRPQGGATLPWAMPGAGRGRLGQEGLPSGAFRTEFFWDDGARKPRNLTSG